VTAHGNDPSRPREIAAGNTLEVVYEGCTAALACEPISSSVARCRAARLCPWAAAWSRANRYSAVIAGSSNETRSLTAMNVPSSPAAPGARAASFSGAIAAKRASYSIRRVVERGGGPDVAAQDGDVLVTGDVGDLALLDFGGRRGGRVACGPGRSSVVG